MKHLFPVLIALAGLATSTAAQEGSCELSKKARKGFIAEAVANEDGYTVTYKMKGDKNKDELAYENYAFGRDLKFRKQESISAPKQTVADKPDRVLSGLYASVGGCTSFDILS